MFQNAGLEPQLFGWTFYFSICDTGIERQLLRPGMEMKGRLLKCEQ